MRFLNYFRLWRELRNTSIIRYRVHDLINKTLWAIFDIFNILENIAKRGGRVFMILANLSQIFCDPFRDKKIAYNVLCTLLMGTQNINFSGERCLVSPKKFDKGFSFSVDCALSIRSPELKFSQYVL